MYSIGECYNMIIVTTVKETLSGARSFSSDKENTMIDVTAPEYLEVVISVDGKTVWINGAFKCLFRACKIKQIKVDDRRAGK